MLKALEHLSGISADDCRRLRSAGIPHTNRLLHAATLDIDRRRLSARTGISPDRLLELAKQCSLLEVSGLDRFVPLVRRLGITSMKDLKRQDSDGLYEKVVAAVGTAQAPSLSEVQYWISQARLCDVIEEEPEERRPVPAIT